MTRTGKKYMYEGPIMVFETCASPSWKAYTTASSEAQARNNLTHKAKQLLGKEAWARVTLPGEIRLVG